MKGLAVLVIAVTVVACSGDSNAPSAAPSAPPPAQVLPPTAPAFPAMTGGWAGTATFTLTNRATGRRDSNICMDTWIITAQTAGRFSGTFQSAGGTPQPCAASGTMAGDVSTTGAVSGLTFTPAASQCSRIAGDGMFSGVISNANALTAQATDAIRCVGQSVTTESDRTIVLALTKR